MVEEFTSRMKVSNFAEMFSLGYLSRKNMAPCEIQTLTLAGRKEGAEVCGMNRTFATIHPVHKVA